MSVLLDHVEPFVSNPKENEEAPRIRESRGFKSLRRVLIQQRLRVGETYWILRSAALSGDGRLSVEAALAERRWMLLDLPFDFDTTSAADMSWLLSRVASLLRSGAVS
jgi:hypothetical protein